ncbi:hypothetical protein [Ottowia thiooxydans]|uniref:Type III secretion protein n=1 Tax=Ottowia thiooxydans TaxID=219182 RepID=A0ABV2QET3_9BURK
MNSLSDIAAALSESISPLEANQWLHIPLDEQRELRLLRSSGKSGVIAVMAQRPLPCTAEEVDALEVMLLGLGVETRWSDRLLGGVDENGWNCISLTLGQPQDAVRVQASLERVLSRLLALTSAASISSSSVGSKGRLMAGGYA